MIDSKLSCFVIKVHALQFNIIFSFPLQLQCQRLFHDRLSSSSENQSIISILKVSMHVNKPGTASSPETNDDNLENILEEIADDSETNIEDVSKYMHIEMQESNQLKQAKLYSFGSAPLLLKNFQRRSVYYQHFAKKSYNWAIHGFGVENFLSYAAYFCKNEALNGTIEVVSIGSGDGHVDRSIMEAYQAHFGTALNITLVDKNTIFKVDYATVNKLIKKRPDVVKNCISLIIWPEPQSGEDRDDGYDIESIRKLQPRAVLIAYEPTGISGSQELVDFLSEGNKFWESDGEMYNAKDFGLENYAIKTVAYQEVHFEADEKTCDVLIPLPPGSTAFRLRMVKLERID